MLDKHFETYSLDKHGYPNNFMNNTLQLLMINESGAKNER